MFERRRAGEESNPPHQRLVVPLPRLPGSRFGLEASFECRLRVGVVLELVVAVIVVKGRTRRGVFGANDWAEASRIFESFTYSQEVERSAHASRRLRVERGPVVLGECPPLAAAMQHKRCPRPVAG
jgi:hypothetical protein